MSICPPMTVTLGDLDEMADKLLAGLDRTATAFANG